MAAKHGDLPLGPLARTPIVVDDFSRRHRERLACAWAAASAAASSTSSSTSSTSSSSSTAPRAAAPAPPPTAAPLLPLHFLSHAHDDHLRGLSPSWRGGRIFCTRVTWALLQVKFPGLDEAWFREVVPDEKQLVWLDERDPARGCVAVTALDAHHVAGGVMFLFEGGFGTVLHTGDFRTEEPQLDAARVLAASALGRVDVVYLDNTYGGSRAPCATLPKRRVALDALRRIMAKYPSNATVSVGVDTLGKEELLVDLAEALGSKVVVSSGRLRRIQATGAFPLDAFTTDPAAGRIRVVSRRDTEVESGADVHIAPTGWCAALPANRRLPGGGGDGLPSDLDPILVELLRITSSAADASELPRRLCLPYSLHSSLSELIKFVLALDPSFVVPTVHVDAGSVAFLERPLPPPAFEGEQARSFMRAYRRQPTASLWGLGLGLDAPDAADARRLSEEDPARQHHHERRHYHHHHHHHPRHRSLLRLSAPLLRDGSTFYEARRDRKRRREHLRQAWQSARGAGSAGPSSPVRGGLAATSLGSSNTWSALEDDILLEMRKAVLSGDEERHASLRRRVATRTDRECTERMRVLASQRQAAGSSPGMAGPASAGLEGEVRMVAVAVAVSMGVAPSPVVPLSA